MADNQTLVEIRRLLDAQLNLHVSCTAANLSVSTTMTGFAIGETLAVLSDSENIPDNWVRIQTIEFRITQDAVGEEVPTGVTWYLSRDQAGAQAITPFTVTTWYQIQGGETCLAVANIDIPYRLNAGQTSGALWLQLGNNSGVAAKVVDVTAFLYWTSNSHPPALSDQGC